MRALGLMSGTSMDGIDLALIETDGDTALSFGPTGFRPYDDADRRVLRAALADATAITADRSDRPGVLGEAEALVTTRHAEAIEQFLSDHGLDPRVIDIVGFHGQTVLHRPERRLTVQIGDGAQLAARCGIAVVSDLRAADVAAGGQGAPLVPVFHQALAQAAGLDLPVMVLNVGGVANLTLVRGAAADPVAFDTGPGNALLDDLMLERTGVAMDRDGAAAAAGQVDEAALRRLLNHPYFALPPPKSLDRNDWSRAPVAALSTEDAAATLIAFTARSIGLAFGLVDERPNAVIVCGGGARNPVLMATLRETLPCTVRDAAALGWTGDAIEAQAFAYLAVRSRRALPLTFPTTTGTPVALTGGVYHEARLLPPAGG